MGYSSRYHAASLAAVFIALAIGILIGIGLADDVVTTASEELEQSLRSQLDEAREEAERLGVELDREREFASTVYPTLVSERLEGSAVALVGLGEVREEAPDEVRAAIEPAGGSLAAVAVLADPPPLRELVEAAGRRPAAARIVEELRRLGRLVGGGIAGGTGLVDRLRGSLFSRMSGSLEGVEFVVVAPPPPDEEAEPQARVEAFLDGLYEGLRDRAPGVVAVERSDAEESGLAAPAEAGIPTVDHVELAAGRVALVLSLLGAEGSYGVKEGADSFLPELLGPSPEAEQVP